MSPRGGVFGLTAEQIGVRWRSVAALRLSLSSLCVVCCNFVNNLSRSLQLQETVYKMCQTHLAPRAAEIDRLNDFPKVPSLSCFVGYYQSLRRSFAFPVFFQ
jgi:hypothetical protein